MKPAHVSQLSWTTAARIAVRELQASAFRFAFVVIAVAIGVGAITGVRAFSRNFADMLRQQARTLMAADLSVRTFALPDDAQQAEIRKLEQQGVKATRVTETLTMVSSGSSATPILGSLKAVDPRLYPLYGKVETQPDQPLAQLLTPDAVLASQELLVRLQTRVGATLRIGAQPFRIVALLEDEPDRLAGSFALGPRLVISQQGLDRTGLITFGSRAAQRYLFRLPAHGAGVEAARSGLKKVFPDAQILDYQESNPTVMRGLNRSTTFLTLVSLIALIVGALGVATTMHAHLQQKLDSIAVMKVMGARSGQIIRIYALQTLLLGSAGGLLGVVLGSVVQRVLPLLIRQYFHFQATLHWEPVAAVQGWVVGILTTFLFTIPPLQSIRRIRPGLLLRRAMPEARPGWRQRLRQSGGALATGMVLLLGIFAIAAWLVSGAGRDSVRLGFWFLGGLAVSLVVLAVTAWALLTTLRWFVRRSPWPLPMVLRHGLANLYRPGSQAVSVLTALGVGVTFTLSIFLVQRSFVRDLVGSTPAGMANVFLLDITPQQRPALVNLLQHQPGVKGAVEILPTVMAKLDSIDGTPVEKLNLSGWGRRFRRPRSVSETATLPPDTRLTQGAWWDSHGTPEVSVSEDAAKLLRLKVGSTLGWTAFGRTLTTRVASIHHTEDRRIHSTIDFYFSPGQLTGLPTIEYGAVHVAPPQVADVERLLYQRYPTVTVINFSEVIDRIQQVVDQIAVVVRFLALFAIVAGVIILASSVASTRFRRIREVVILKTLGATRARIVRIFSTEFLVLGAVAGLMGSILATLFSHFVLKRFLEARFTLDAGPVLITIVLTAALAAAAGWLASFRILGQKPLQVLREE